MQFTKFLQESREEVFDAFTNPRKLEQWYFTEGHSLKVLKYEAKSGGKFEYVFSGPGETSSCVGTIKEFVPNERLVVIDENVTNADGKIESRNLRGFISFRDHEDGTELVIRQEGFGNNKEAFKCEQGWVDSLFKLSNVLARYGKRRPPEGQEIGARI